MMQGPPTLPDNAPVDLKQAERIIQAAIRELVLLAEQIAVWRVLGADETMHHRLSTSNVGTMTYSIYLTLQNSIVLGLARLFDDEKGALHAGQAFNRITEPANADWLLKYRKAQMRSAGVMMLPRPDVSEADQTETARYLQEHNAQQAGAAFDRHRTEFIQARRKFNSGEVNQALLRLKEMRRKEVAHTDLQPVWRTDRPKQGDLRLVFDAVRKLVWTANFLLLGSDHADLRDFDQFEIRARCFTAVLRAETYNEYHAAVAAARSDQAST